MQTLSAEKQADLRVEMNAFTMDGIPTADSVAIVAYAFATRIADGVTGECIVADSGMLRNILTFLPEVKAYPPQT